jgi:NTP pyrophosphatase (non-canonical NTP hydrolase)
MKISEFESFVRDHAQVGLDNLAYSVIGLCGESGEVAEWYKKVHMRSKPSKLTLDDLKSELGDVIHYVARIALAHNWTLKDCMEDNVSKIEKRHAKSLPESIHDRDLHRAECESSGPQSLSCCVVYGRDSFIHLVD